MESLEEVRQRLRNGELPFAGRMISDTAGDEEDDFGWRVLRSGLPPITFDSMRIEHWEQRPGKGLKEALDAAMAMAQGEDKFCLLTLAGPTGVGKTHLGIAIAWEWLLAGGFVIYRQVEELLDELRETFGIPPGQALEMKLPPFKTVLNKFKSCHLLVMDELGGEKPTEWTLARLDSILDYRWLNRLPTVVTTNAKSEDLAPRIVDRLQDFRCGRVVLIAASSYRREGGRHRGDTEKL